MNMITNAYQNAIREHTQKCIHLFLHKLLDEFKWHCVKCTARVKKITNGILRDTNKQI